MRRGVLQVFAIQTGFKKWSIYKTNLSKHLGPPLLNNHVGGSFNLFKCHHWGCLNSKFGDSNQHMKSLFCEFLDNLSYLMIMGKHWGRSDANCLEIQNTISILYLYKKSVHCIVILKICILLVPRICILQVFRAFRSRFTLLYSSRNSIEMASAYVIRCFFFFFFLGGWVGGYYPLWLALNSWLKRYLFFKITFMDYVLYCTAKIWIFCGVAKFSVFWSQNLYFTERCFVFHVEGLASL